IQHQSRSREQTGMHAQVLRGNGVGAAACGIGGDGLAIREKDDRQQSYDRQTDRENIGHAGQAERDQQREGSFRAVGGGTQRVETEDGYSSRYPDLLSAFIERSQRFTQNYVDDRHSSSQHSNAKCKQWYNGKKAIILKNQGMIGPCRVLVIS